MLMAAEPTAFGRFVQPHSVVSFDYRIRMKSVKVLWANVSALMSHHYGKENLTRLAGDAGIGPGTMSRLKKQETSIGLDIIEKVAKTFKVKPWQILVPGFDVQHPPEACPWPFLSINPDDYYDMDPSDRKAIEQQAMHAVQRHQKTKLIYRKPTIEIETNNMQLERKKP